MTTFWVAVTATQNCFRHGGNSMKFKQSLVGFAVAFVLAFAFGRMNVQAQSQDNMTLDEFMSASLTLMIDILNRVERIEQILADNGQVTALETRVALLEGARDQPNRVAATRTPAPTPTLTPTPVPPTPTAVPTSTSQVQSELYELAYFVVSLDQRSIGRLESWENTSTAEQAEVVDVMGTFLLVTADYCDLSVDEMTELIYKYGAIVDESGYSIRNEYAPRTNLLYELIQYSEDNPRRNSCDQLMEWRVILLLAEE